jgi:hypothetical protein
MEPLLINTGTEMLTSAYVTVRVLRSALNYCMHNAVCWCRVVESLPPENREAPSYFSTKLWTAAEHSLMLHTSLRLCRYGESWLVVILSLRNFCIWKHLFFFYEINTFPSPLHSIPEASHTAVFPLKMKPRRSKGTTQHTKHFSSIKSLIGMQIRIEQLPLFVGRISLYRCDHMQEILITIKL